MAQIISVEKYTCLHLPIGTRLRPIYTIGSSTESSSSSVTWFPPIKRSEVGAPVGSQGERGNFIGSCNLSKLLRDMSAYKLGPNYQNGHSGDLMDHSLWTYYLLATETALPKMFQPWFLQNIPEEYYPVLQVAGLLHDIGKSGDLETKYNQKPTHPLQSWLYFQDMADYIWADGTKIPLKDYLTENCALTKEEWSLVGIIAALHYDLGDFFEHKLTSGGIINRLNMHIKFTGILFDPVVVFRLLRAVTFADIWAQRPVKHADGFIQIDTDVVAVQKRPIKENSFLTEERFSQSRELEEQISGLKSNICVGPIASYMYDTEGNVVVTRPINLIVLTPQNIQILLNDPESPYSSLVELDPDIYKLLTKRDKNALRKYLIRELITEIEICSFSSAKEARNKIYQWYFSAGENKLSGESLSNLIKILHEYPRPDWTSERVEMSIRRLVSPDYNLEQFVQEYDKNYYNERIKYLESEIQILMKLVASLEFKYSGIPFESWNGLLELMSRDDSFQIPLLSAKGLLLLLTIFQELSCRPYQNTIINNLLNYITTSPTGLFGEKYNIYGLYVDASNRINLLSPYKVTPLFFVNKKLKKS